jgi:hypothetical protein
MKVLQNGKMFPISGQVFCFENVQEAYNPECLLPTVKYVGKSVVIWAAISCYSVGLFTLNG